MGDEDFTRCSNTCGLRNLINTKVMLHIKIKNSITTSYILSIKWTHACIPKYEISMKTTFKVGGGMAKTRLQGGNRTDGLFLGTLYITI